MHDARLHCSPNATTQSENSGHKSQKSSYNLCIHVYSNTRQVPFRLRKINYIQKKTNFRNTLIPLFASALPLLPHRTFSFGLSLNPLLSFAFAFRYLYSSACLFICSLSLPHRVQISTFQSNFVCQMWERCSTFMPYALINCFMLMKHRQRAAREI